MKRAAEFLGVVWALFWRAAVFSIPSFLGLLAGFAFLILPPGWAICSFFWAPWWQGVLVLAAWLALLLLGLRYLARNTPGEDRYRDGVI